MNSEPKQNSHPEGPVLRFPTLKSGSDSKTPVHQVPTTRPIDPPVTPAPSVTPISTTTPPSLALPLPLVRQRTAQACDKCRERKTKCSGQRPCARCVARGLLCKYSVRESRHRSPFRGIRGSGGPSGNSCSAERSRYIDSSTRTVPSSTSDPTTTHSNTSISMPTYHIRPSNPNFSGTPAFAQRSYLDERIPSQRYHMSQYNTHGRVDSTRSTQEGLDIGNRLQDQWQQEGPRAQAKYMGYEDRRNARSVPFDAPTNGVVNDGQLGLNLNQNAAEALDMTSSQSSRAMYGGGNFPAINDSSTQLRASIEAPTRGGHWNFNIELTQYENAGLQPPVPPSTDLQKYVGDPSWSNLPTSRNAQKFESIPNRYSNVESRDAQGENRELGDYWGEDFSSSSSSGDYEKSYFNPANPSKARGHSEGTSNGFNIRGDTNQQQQYQDTFGVRRPFPRASQNQNQSHYTNSGSFSNELDLSANNAYSRDLGHSDNRISGFGRSQHEQQPHPSLELNHPMPVTPIGTQFASALSMPMHNRLAQFQGMERGATYHRELNGYSSTPECHSDSLNFPPSETFAST